MSDKFAAILDRPVSEIEAPKPIPVGTYRAIVKGLPRYDKSSKKQTDFVEFTLAISSAEGDVDEKALSEYLLNEKTGKSKALSDTIMKNTFYLTEDAAWRLKKFLGDLGFDTESDEETPRQQIESSAGSEVYITVKHRATEDGKRVFAEIADTAKVD